MNLSIPTDTSDALFHSTMSTQTLQAQAATSMTMVGDLTSTSKLLLRNSRRRSPQAVDHWVEEILATCQKEEDLSCHRHLQEEVVGQVVEGEAQEVGGMNGKLTENPPTEFNSDHLKVETFQNKFYLYILMNIDVEAMVDLMKQLPCSQLHQRGVDQGLDQTLDQLDD